MKNIRRLAVHLNSPSFAAFALQQSSSYPAQYPKPRRSPKYPQYPTCSQHSDSGQIYWTRVAPDDIRAITNDLLSAFTQMCLN